MPKMIDYSGMKLGKLQVINRYGYDNNGRITWLCRCDCGFEVVVVGYNLKRNQGCVHCRNNNTTHGLYYTRLHKIWSNMKNRCSNPKCNRWHRYGGRGITVCDEWKNSFKAFYDWAITHGYKDDLSIDRIDNDKGYFPANCRWATAKEQANNQSHPKRGKYRKNYNNRGG